MFLYIDVILSVASVINNFEDDFLKVFHIFYFTLLLSLKRKIIIIHFKIHPGWAFGPNFLEEWNPTLLCCGLFELDNI